MWVCIVLLFVIANMLALNDLNAAGCTWDDYVDFMAASDVHKFFLKCIYIIPTICSWLNKLFKRN